VKKRPGNGTSGILTNQEVPEKGNGRGDREDFVKRASTPGDCPVLRANGGKRVIGIMSFWGSNVENRPLG